MNKNGYAKRNRGSVYEFILIDVKLFIKKKSITKKSAVTLS